MSFCGLVIGFCYWVFVLFCCLGFVIFVNYCILNVRCDLLLVFYYGLLLYSIFILIYMWYKNIEIVLYKCRLFNKIRMLLDFILDLIFSFKIFLNRYILMFKIC